MLFVRFILVAVLLVLVVNSCVLQAILVYCRPSCMLVRACGIAEPVHDSHLWASYIIGLYREAATPQQYTAML